MSVRYHGRQALWGGEGSSPVSIGDYAAFFIPLVFLAVLYEQRAHFRAHRLALGALVLLTAVSILHFDVGMLTTDPYHEFLRDSGTPNHTWTASVIVLMVLSYAGLAREALQERRRPRQRAPRRPRVTPGR